MNSTIATSPPWTILHVHHNVIDTTSQARVKSATFNSYQTTAHTPSNLGFQSLRFTSPSSSSFPEEKWRLELQHMIESSLLSADWMLEAPVKFCNKSCCSVDKTTAQSYKSWWQGKWLCINLTHRMPFSNSTPCHGTSMLVPQSGIRWLESFRIHQALS